MAGSVKPSEKPSVVQVFTDVTSETGIDFVHEDGPPESFEFPRSMGSGCGWFDANGDGRLDAIFVNGGKRIEPGHAGTLAFLYLQRPDGRFDDATADSGLVGEGYGMGLAIGDVDNDGDSDVYLTKYGPDQLYLNDGSGRFSDVSINAGIVNPQWSTAAAFSDVNNDGWLDIVVANYVDYFPRTFCADAASRPDFCGPQDFSGTPNRIFMNLGAVANGGVQFIDRSGESGLAALSGKSLGLVCRDFDHDGDVDIFVANDGEANQLWIQNNSTFEDEAFLRGVAVNRFGEPEANMGAAVADLSGDGHADLLVTHLSGEMNTLWQGDAHGHFIDRTSQFRIGPAGLGQTGFGVIAADINCDAYPDILVANGKVKRDRHKVAISHLFWDNYAERNQIFVGDGKDFLELNDGTSGFTMENGVYRGLAVGDYDLDGDLDLLVSSIGASARIFRNDVERKGHWLSIVPYDAEHSRIALGARVFVKTKTTHWTTEVLPHQSYLSSQEPVAHFGLGATSILSSICVIWPDDPSHDEAFPSVSVDQRITIIRGQGHLRKLPVNSEAN